MENVNVEQFVHDEYFDDDVVDFSAMMNMVVELVIVIVAVAAAEYGYVDLFRPLKYQYNHHRQSLII